MKNKERQLNHKGAEMKHKDEARYKAKPLGKIEINGGALR